MGANRIGIDARSLRSGPAGVGTYVRNLLHEIPELVSIDRTWPRNNLLWNCLWGPICQVSLRLDLFQAPAYTAPLWNWTRVVLNIHDVSYLVNPDWYPHELDSLRRWYYRASIRRASRILVPSGFSAREVARLFPEQRRRVRVVPLGVSEAFRPDPEMATVVRRQFELPEHFLLHVGDLHRRRNIPLMERVSRRVGYPLVLVGKELDSDIRLSERVIRLEGLSLCELRGVYSAGTLLLYPSLYEGFGLPLIEAMACGLPVVASDQASIPEVTGKAGIIVPPREEEFFEGVRDALENLDVLRRRGLERAETFSWKETAQKTRAVYEEILESPSTDDVGET